MRDDGQRHLEPMQGVERAITVLEHLAMSDHPCGPSEVSRALGLSKPAVVRILQTWSTLGYVERIDGQYELGWKILILANARSEAQDLQRGARSFMTWLSAKSGETIHLAVRRGSSAIYTDKIDGSRRIRVQGDIGRAAPLYATASGKAILAYLPSEMAEDVIGRPVTPWTPFTITDVKRLQKDLAETRERGYSVNNGEWHEQVGGVGAAIFDRDGTVEAALSILYPTTEVDAPRIAQLGELVRSAAERLSLQRGWRGTLVIGPPAALDGWPLSSLGLDHGTDETHGAAGDRLEPVG